MCVSVFSFKHDMWVYMWYLHQVFPPTLDCVDDMWVLCCAMSFSKIVGMSPLAFGYHDRYYIEDVNA